MDYIIWWIVLFLFLLGLDFLIFRPKRRQIRDSDEEEPPEDDYE